MANTTRLSFGNYNKLAAQARDLYEDRKPCTLDGRPATISGFALQFGMVRSLDGKMSGEWNWQAIVTIMENGGEFTL